MKKFINNKIIGWTLIGAGLALIIVFAVKFNWPAKVKDIRPTIIPAKLKGRPLGILITEPKLKAVIADPVTIKGSATLANFKNNLIDFKIIDKQAVVLGQGVSQPGAKQADGNFAFEAKVDFKTGAKGLGFIMINDNVNYKFPIQF